MTKNLAAVRAEAHLEGIKLATYLEEDALVQFVKNCPRGLRLDWVANFARIIPEDIREVKRKCDDRYIFDNYVVLHYDPEGKAWAETETEKEARKDPILFGVISGRRRLYLVGEWVDELCDLTMDQIADVIGKNQVKSLAT